ncbi:DUF6455 family protein [uncultured Ruegeria sp.]|jgi:hypothetical protein|uniref:DUF6455 family protein n=1 Tax=uncultured Ruegeria sp. TaxID=259304 RepID=UPI0026390696|nr:DUF6455 family protein [uncultured Ruegeria sp.]
MPSRETLRLHAGLVDEMAKMLDVDLEEAAIGGSVSIDQISDAVVRCTECPNPAHCQSTISDTAFLNHTPEYCRNRDLLHKLMP